MEFGNRLKAYRLDRGYTQKELGNMIGVSEVTVGNWERGVKYPNVTILMSLCSALSVSLDAITGFEAGAIASDDIILSRSEHILIGKYRVLDKFGKKAVEAVCDVEYSRSCAEPYCDSISSNVIPIRGRGNDRSIPAFTIPSAAGIAVPLDGSEVDRVLSGSSVPDGADFAVRIQGDSMMPYIHDGDLVFVKKDAEINNGDVGIFCVDGAMYCKQFFKDDDGNVYLLSANHLRTDANVYLSADCSSDFRSNGKVIMQDIPLPEYFNL